MRPMSWLVVGSKGFVGSRLTSHLENTNQPHHGADIGGRTTSRYTALESANPDYLALIEKQAPKWVINCAGAASVPQSLADPARDFALNTALVVQLMEAIRAAAPKAKFINLSSAAVY